MCLRAGIALCFLSVFAFGAAASLASSFGVLAMVAMLPAIYLAMGLALVAGTVAAKWALLPQFHAGQSVPLWSSDFARWWLVNRLVDVTNQLFVRHFRGTLLLNWYFNLLVRPLG